MEPNLFIVPCRNITKSIVMLANNFFFQFVCLFACLFVLLLLYYYFFFVSFFFFFVEAKLAPKMAYVPTNYTSDW